MAELLAAMENVVTALAGYASMGEWTEADAKAWAAIEALDKAKEKAKAK